MNNQGMDVQPSCAQNEFRKTLVTFMFATLALPMVVSIAGMRAQDRSSSESAAAAARQEFEVASIRARGADSVGRGSAGRCEQLVKIDGSRINIECTTLPNLIGYAFRISPNRITAPDWMDGRRSPRFDIIANLPTGASENQIPEMIQALLPDRFKLAVHRETTNQTIYALVVAKGELKVREAAPEAVAPVQASTSVPDAPPSSITVYGDIQIRRTPNEDGIGSTKTISSPHMGTVRETNGPNRTQRWEAPNVTFEGLADLLDRVAPLESPVIDMTGLKGRYQLVLEVSVNDLAGARPAMTSIGDRPTAIGNVQIDLEESALEAFNDGLRKLGLRLERRKGPVETVVVDHAEEAPTQN